jgi:hypothetical protein
MAGYIGSKASVVSSGAEHKKLFNITTTTTSLTGLVYTPTLVHVFHNGVRLVDGTDYTATTGTSITLTVAAENGDQVAVVSYATFQTSDTVSASAGGTFGGAVDVNADGATVLTVDRATSDGTIIDVQKNGTTVGSIGAVSGDLYIGNSTVGLRIDETSTDTISPFNPNTLAVRDAGIDLGYSAGRWKNLYLSGGVYLGGTGSANHLDDYEEGTFVATLRGVTQPATLITASVASYVKIGKLVTFNINFVNADTTGYAGNMFVQSLPFTLVGNGNVSVVSYNMATWTDQIAVEIGVDQINVMDIRSGTTWINAQHNAGTGRYMYISGSIYTA